MYDFPVMFDHINMALFRIRFLWEGAYLDYDRNELLLSEDRDIAIFLTFGAAKAMFDSMKIEDFLTKDEEETADYAELVLEMWTIDECNPAECAKRIEEKRFI